MRWESRETGTCELDIENERQINMTGNAEHLALLSEKKEKLEEYHGE
jgi:hypothetical protein